jgi:hypothetical protein
MTFDSGGVGKIGAAARVTFGLGFGGRFCKTASIADGPSAGDLSSCVFRLECV